MPSAPSAPSERAGNKPHPIVLYDGICKFCNGSVQFLIRHDTRDVLRFAALQSDYAQELLPSELKKSTGLDTIILFDGQRFYFRSDAVLRICRHLGGLWSLMYAFIVIPRPIRDGLYRWLAKRRYKLFGKYDSCMIPSEAVRSKFLD